MGRFRCYSPYLPLPAPDIALDTQVSDAPRKCHVGRRQGGGVYLTSGRVVCNVVQRHFTLILFSQIQQCGWVTK
jgi:hypothetical protein